MSLTITGSSIWECPVYVIFYASAVLSVLVSAFFTAKILIHLFLNDDIHNTKVNIERGDNQRSSKLVIGVGLFLMFLFFMTAALVKRFVCN